MKKQKTPYYNAEANYSVKNVTEIGYLSNDEYWLNVAHIKDITFKDKDITIIQNGFYSMMITKDLSTDWILLYECTVFDEFPHNLNISENRKYFAVSQKTGVYQLIDAYKLDGKDVVKGAKEFLDSADIYNDIGYIRKLDATDRPADCGMTSVGKIKNGNFRHNLANAFIEFFKNIKTLIKDRKDINNEFKKYTNALNQAKLNHLKFKGEK